MSFLLPALIAIATQHAPSQSTTTGQERRTEIIRRVLEYGETRFGAQDEAAPDDPRSSLLRDPAGEPSYAEGSLEYAAALLMSGTGAERADAIVGTVLDAQAKGGKLPGGFPWRPGEEPSAYATAYLAPWLAYIDQHLAAELGESTRTRLRDSLKPALAAAAKFGTKPEETQRYLVRTAALATLGAAAGDGAAQARAAKDLASWVAYTSQNGLPILQDPSATVVCVAALQWVWREPPDEASKANAAAALEYLYRDLALRCHPKAGMAAGAAVRAHRGDYALGTGATRYLLFAQFGRPELVMAESFAMFLAIDGFTPNEETLRIAQAIDTPRTVYARAGERGMATYLQPRYALGTMSGPVESGTAPVVLTYGVEGEPGAYCEVTPTPARVTAAQQEGMALVSFDFDDIGYEDARLYVRATVRLGPRAALDAVLVNQTPYTVDYPAAVESRSAVVTDREGVYTAFVPIVAGPAVAKAYDSQPGTPELAWEGQGEDAELVLTVPARTLRARETARDNYRIALAVLVASREDYASVGDFAAYVYDKTRTSCETKAKQVKVGEKLEGVHKYLPGYHRPVERGRWIFETRVVQELVFRSDAQALGITEDLEKNEVLELWQGGGEFAWDFLYRSPSLNHVPGDALTTVLRPPPPPPEPTAAAEEGAEETTGQP